jgi:hypothetical protein
VSKVSASLGTNPKRLVGVFKPSRVISIEAIRPAAIIEGFVVILFDGQRFVVIHNGLVILAQVGIRSTAIVEGFEVIRLDFQRGIEIRYGLVILAVVTIRKATIVIRRCIGRTYLQRPVKLFDGLAVLLLVVTRNASFAALCAFVWSTRGRLPPLQNKEYSAIPGTPGYTPGISNRQPLSGEKLRRMVSKNSQNIAGNPKSFWV